MRLKQTIAVMAGMVLAVGAMAQGVLTFANGSDSRVIDNSTGLPVGQNIVKAGLYYSTALGATPNTAIPDDGWILVPESIVNVTVSTSSLAQGRFAKSGVVIQGLTGGTTILAQARIWSVAYDTYAAAMGSTDAKVGASDFGQLVLTEPPTPVNTTDAIFNSPINLRLVPEPSTVVLGILGGLGALVLFRRRS